MNDKENKPKALQKFLFSIGILYVVATPLLLNFSKITQGMAIFMLISGVLLALFSRFEDLKELRLFGLIAKIERALNDAYATLEQVKEFAKISAGSSLSNTARAGWLGGMSDQQTREILTSTQETLKRLGCDDHEIKDVCKDFHDCQLTEYRQVLLGGGSSRIPESQDRECRREWDALRERAVSPPIPPDELRTFFEKHNFMDEERRKRLEGYAYYYEHHEFQDFEDFKNRQEWPYLNALD